MNKHTCTLEWVGHYVWDRYSEALCQCFTCGEVVLFDHYTTPFRSFEDALAILGEEQVHLFPPLPTKEGKEI